MREILSFEGTTKVCKYKHGWQCHPPTPSYFTTWFDCLPHLNYTRCCITWSCPRLSRERSRVSTVLGGCCLASLRKRKWKHVLNCYVLLLPMVGVTDWDRKEDASKKLEAKAKRWDEISDQSQGLLAYGLAEHSANARPVGLHGRHLKLFLLLPFRHQENCRTLEHLLSLGCADCVWILGLGLFIRIIN